jgi:hypothetical protein
MEAALAWFMPGPFNLALSGEEKPKTLVFLNEGQHLRESRIRREFTTIRQGGQH